MNPENKSFVLAMIDKLPISASTLDDAIMYHMILPDDQPLTICADITVLDTSSSIIYYTISINSDILEEATVDTSTNKIPPVAQDIIQIMRKCSAKVIMQEARRTHSKFMTNMITNSKTLS